MFKLDSIEFQFENCEGFSIDGKYIKDLTISDLETCITNLGGNRGMYMKMFSANKVNIIISSDGNKKYEPFGCGDIAEYKFDRLLKSKDVVSVVLRYGETEEEYYVKWIGDSEYTNEIQDVCILDSGDLQFRVGEE